MPGWLTARDTAARLGIPEKWLRERLRAGAVRTRRDANGRYLLPDRPEAHEALLRLRAGAIEAVDLAPSVVEEKGHQDA